MFLYSIIRFYFSGGIQLADILRFHGPIKRLRLDLMRRSGSVGPEPVWIVYIDLLIEDISKPCFPFQVELILEKDNEKMISAVQKHWDLWHELFLGTDEREAKDPLILMIAVLRQCEEGESQGSFVDRI